MMLLLVLKADAWLKQKMSCWSINSFDFGAVKTAFALKRSCNSSRAKSNELTDQQDMFFYMPWWFEWFLTDGKFMIHALYCSCVCFAISQNKQYPFLYKFATNWMLDCYIIVTAILVQVTSMYFFSLSDKTTKSRLVFELGDLLLELLYC